MTCEFCVAAHECRFCSLNHYQYHILLTADEHLIDIFIKLDQLCFNFQRLDCFYTLFKYILSRIVLVKSGEVFDTTEKDVFFNKLNKGEDKLPSLAKKRLLRKKLKKHMPTSNKNLTSVHRSGSLFVERVEGVRRPIKLDFERMQVIDCFLDGYGGYESNLVPLKIKNCI